MTGRNTFTRRLIDLISRAAFIDLDGQEVEQIDQLPNGIVRLVTSTDQTLDFDPRQLVTLDDEGYGRASTADGTVAELIFMALRPLTVEDCLDEASNGSGEAS